MNLTGFQQGLKKAKHEIQSALQGEGAKAGADAAALIEDRIVTKGEKNNGQKFSPYSNKEVPAFLYFGKSRNGAGESAVKKAAKDKQGVSYSDFRRFNGLNTNVKNFQFTGEMFQNFGVRSVRVIGQGIIEIEIGGKNARSNLLLKAHSEREDSELTAPSKNEVQLVVNGIQERIKTIINRNI